MLDIPVRMYHSASSSLSNTINVREPFPKRYHINNLPRYFIPKLTRFGVSRSTRGGPHTGVPTQLNRILASSRLLPHTVDTDQTADGTSNTNESIIEVGPTQGRRRYCEIAQV